MSKKILLLLLVIIIAFILRFSKLGSNPPSLSWDEASLGYNAYTILTSGKDEHGESYPLARFIAFGDFKPPGYIYTTVPSVYLFGLDEFSTRLPSAIAGLLMVIFTYLLVKELFGNEKIALISSLLLAISPWALQFSRTAFESNLATFFNLLAVYCFILSFKKKWIILLSVIFFIASFYTFNANRIIAPLLLVSLILLYYKYSLKNLTWFLVSAVIGVLLILPSISYLRSRESKVRFQEVSIFNNLNRVELSNRRIELDNYSGWAKILHNRRILFAQDFLKHYFDNFGGRFLLVSGDANPRLSIQEMGELYIWELPFLIIGVLCLVISKEKALLPVFLWMVIAPIPAATARETPHALRILSILPTYQIIIAYGLYKFFFWLKGKNKYLVFKSSAIGIFSLIFIFSVYSYLHNYYVHYPINWSGEWQFGYKELVSYVSQNENKYEKVFVTPSLGRPYIYFAFYQKYPLPQFLSDQVASRDWFGFWTVSKLRKVNFDLKDVNNSKGKTLLATTDAKLPAGFSLLKTINEPGGNIIFYIAEKI